MPDPYVLRVVRILNNCAFAFNKFQFILFGLFRFPLRNFPQVEFA